MTTKTAGQQLTDKLRTYFGIGSRTRTRRNGLNLRDAMIEMLEVNAQYPGYNTPETTEILRPGFSVACAYRKHVEGCRIDGQLARVIREMSPWQFAALLGRMVDAGVTNTYQGEVFFQQMTRDLYTKAA